MSEGPQILEQEFPVAGLPGAPLRIRRVKDSYALLDAVDPEAFQKDERMPYWAELWPASRALAEELVARGVAGRRVLELGAGVGAVSVAAARLGAQVTATDYFEEALAFIADNAARNQVALTAAYLDFRRVEGLPRYELVIGSDLLYERRNHAPLLGALRRLLEPAGVGLLADPQRLTAREFPESARRVGFAVAVREREGIDLYELRPR